MISQDGIVVIDKPAGITSHDVVARLRKVFKTRRVGHGGTLDPMATGILVIGINNGTKALSFISEASKSYSATIRLGVSTHTDDAQGDILSSSDASHLTDEEIRSALNAMVGTIQQVPSSVSAIKVNGERAHALVRAGETVELKARTITIFSIDIHDIFRSGTFVEVDVTVKCSSGTYIRAIARDLGNVLKVGGHLTALRRVESSGFTLDDAVELENAYKGFQSLRDALKHFMPEVVVTPEQELLVSRGQRFAYPVEAGNVAVVNGKGELIAIGERITDGETTLLGYHSVFNAGASS